MEKVGWKKTKKMKKKIHVKSLREMLGLVESKEAKDSVSKRIFLRRGIKSREKKYQEHKSESKKGNVYRLSFILAI